MARLINRNVLFTIILGVLFYGNGLLYAGEAATKFDIYVPPNNSNSNRDVALIVTALQNKTEFVVTDDAADGDSDDSFAGTLNEGESYVLFIKDNGVNDDAGGKWDGDYFIIEANYPVLVSETTSSDWQHDWVPANNGKMQGNTFYLYASPTLFSNRDVNIFAYSNNTNVIIKDVTSVPTLNTGITSVRLRNADIVAQFKLDIGEDIINTYNYGRDLFQPGHTYLVQTNKPVTVQFGALYKNIFDGGGFVPASSGLENGELFYFVVPGQVAGQQQIQVTSLDDNNNVKVDYYDNGSWNNMAGWYLNRSEKSEWRAKPAEIINKVFRVTCTSGNKVSVFEANRQASADSTSDDVANNIASETGLAAGTRFNCPLAPPSTQDNCLNPFTGRPYDTSDNTHLFFFTDENSTNITVKDLKTDGQVLTRAFNIDKNNYADFIIDRSLYDQVQQSENQAQNNSGRPSLLVESDKPISVMGSNWNDNWMTYMGSNRLPEMASTTSVDRDEVVVDETVAITSVIKNIGRELIENTYAEIKLPDGLKFLTAKMSNSNGFDFGNGALQDNEDGTKIITWDDISLPENDSLTINLTCKSDAGHLPDKDVIGVITSARGESRGRKVATQNSKGLLVNSASGDMKSYSRLIAFEDLKGLSWNDWDYNDFVVRIDTKVFLTRNRTVDKLIIDYEAVARGASRKHSFNQKIIFSGSATSTLSVFDSSGILLNSYSENQQDGLDIIIFPSTMESLPPLPGATGSNTHKYQLSVVKGQRAQLVIEFASPDLNPFTKFQKPPFDPYLEVGEELAQRTGDEIHVVEFAGTKIGNTQNLDNVGKDNPLYGYPLDLAISVDPDWLWPYETHYPIWLAYPEFVKYVLSGKRKNTNWFKSPDLESVWQRSSQQRGISGDIDKKLSENRQNEDRETLLQAERYQAGYPLELDEKIFASPLLYDFNGDGAMEVVVAAMDGKVHLLNGQGQELPGWPIATGNLIRSSASIGEIDGDTQTEILIGTETGRLYAWHVDGSLQPGWPLQVDGPVKSSLIVADLEGDLTNEIILTAGDGKVYAFDHEGNYRPGWPQETDGNVDQFGEMLITSSVGVYDLNGDRKKEIFAGATDGKIYFWNDQGQLLSGFPILTDDWLYASPSVGQFDHESDLEVVFISGSGRVYVLKADASFVPGFPIQLESRVVASPALGDVDNDGKLEIVVGGLDNVVYAINNDGSIVENWPVSTYGSVFSSAALADIDADGITEILVGANDGVLYTWKPDGSSDEKYIRWLGNTSGWIVASPSIGDVDGDGDMDIVIGTYDKKLYAIDLDTPYAQESVQWSMFRGTPERTGTTEAATDPGLAIDEFAAKRAFVYPNPLTANEPVNFRIEFDFSTLPEAITLGIFDLAGELVRKVKQNELLLTNTAYEFAWDCKNGKGLQVANGVYIFKFDSMKNGDQDVKIGKVALIR